MDNRIYSLSSSYSLFKGEFNTEKYYLFNIEEGTIYRLNEVSYDIISLFDGFRDINTIIGMFGEQYRGDQDKMKADIERLTGIWLDKSILVQGGE